MVETLLESEIVSVIEYGFFTSHVFIRKLIHCIGWLWRHLDIYTKTLFWNYDSTSFSLLWHNSCSVWQNFDITLELKYVCTTIKLKQLLYSLDHSSITLCANLIWLVYSLHFCQKLLDLPLAPYLFKITCFVSLYWVEGKSIFKYACTDPFQGHLIVFIIVSS